MKIGDLKKLRGFIRNGYYEYSVYLAKELGLDARFEVEDCDPNVVSYFEIVYQNRDGICYTLLDAAHTTGMAGWYRVEGRWTY